MTHVIDWLMNKEAATNKTPEATKRWDPEVKQTKTVGQPPRFNESRAIEADPKYSNSVKPMGKRPSDSNEVRALEADPRYNTKR